MDEIFKQYGSTIITVLAIIAVIGIIALVIGNDNNSIIYQKFTELITNFYDKANASAGMPVTP